MSWSLAVFSVRFLLWMSALKRVHEQNFNNSFCPCSAREINKGDEIAWYADGDHTVRSESNPNIAYGFGTY